MTDDEHSDDDCQNPPPCGSCMAVKVFELTRDAESFFELPTYAKLSVAGEFINTALSIAAHVSLSAHKDRAKRAAEALVDRAVRWRVQASNAARRC